jgi:tetratricopeptide (TPR) repeat protein
VTDAVFYLMTMEHPSPAIDNDNPRVAPRVTARKTGWIWVSTLCGLAALVAGLWWNSLRPENCYRRGRRALDAGDHATVYREIRRLIDTPDYEPQGRLLSGLLLARDGKPAEALAELKFALDDDMTALEATTSAAACYYALGQYVATVETAKAALARDADALEARRWLAAAEYDLGRTGDAEDNLAIISEQAPHDPRPERLRGLISKDFAEYGAAIDHYRESLRRDPQWDRDNILAELAESQVKLGRFDEAVETLRECERTAPVLVLEAECAENQGQIDTALELLHEALEADPLSLPAKLKRGALLLLQGKSDQAVGVLEDAVRQAPYNSQAHFSLSQAYSRRGEIEKAEAQLRLRRETEKDEQLFPELHKLAEEKPNDPDVRYQLGVLARRLGKPDLARMWFRSALAVSPRHVQARAALAETSEGQAP